MSDSRKMKQKIDEEIRRSQENKEKNEYDKAHPENFKRPTSTRHIIKLKNALFSLKEPSELKGKRLQELIVNWIILVTIITAFTFMFLLSAAVESKQYDTKVKVEIIRLYQFLTSWSLVLLFLAACMKVTYKRLRRKGRYWPVKKNYVASGFEETKGTFSKIKQMLNSKTKDKGDEDEQK